MRSLIFLCLMLSQSCKPNNGNGETQLNKDFQEAIHKVNSIEETKNYEVYLVIPNTGCSGCISSAESLLIENYKKTKKIKFVLTRIESFKNLYLKLRLDVKSEPNILIDKDNIFSQKPFASIYPQVFFVDKQTGNITGKDEISPTGNAVAQISKLIK